MISWAVDRLVHAIRQTPCWRPVAITPAHGSSIIAGRWELVDEDSVPKRIFLTQQAFFLGSFPEKTTHWFPFPDDAPEIPENLTLED